MIYFEKRDLKSI